MTRQIAIAALALLFCMCPMSTTCPQDGLPAHYVGVSYSADGHELCNYDCPNSHRVVMRCD